MDARTEEIRARVERAHVLGPCTHGYEADDADLCDACNRDWEKVVSEIVVVDVPYLLTELTALREEVERLKGALEIAFVQGAQWWEWERTSFTMWGADRNRAEAEAAKLNAAGTLGMTYEERMKREAALSPSPAQQEPK